MERYALLWLLSAVVLLALAIWRDALAKISHAIGVIYPPNALFFIAIGFILLLLLHFSSAVSRLSDQSETLAQRQALLDERLHRHERLNGDSPGLNDDSGAEIVDDDPEENPEAEIADNPEEDYGAEIAAGPDKMVRTPVD
jgi:hypothetical protein